VSIEKKEADTTDKVSIKKKPETTVEENKEKEDEL
jgi:hypothetical protein